MARTMNPLGPALISDGKAGRGFLVMPRLLLRLLFLGGWLFLAGLPGCNTISPYDQMAYAQVVNVKVDALALMDKATDSYDGHRKDVEAINLEIDKAYEYEKGRALNTITVEQWDLLRSPDHDLFGGFLKSWQAKGRLSAYFVAAKKKQVSAAFDQIIQLESQKNR